MNYSNIYNINFRKLGDLLTPPFLRKAALIDWIECLLKPLEEVNVNFKIFRKASIYKVTHNGQVVYLQKVLNDYFDKEERRIYIKDVFYRNPLYIYPETDEKPVYIYDNEPVYVYDDNDFNLPDYEFVVYIPIALKPVNDIDIINIEIQIKSLVNYYKLASKRYLIKWI